MSKKRKGAQLQVEIPRDKRRRLYPMLWQRDEVSRYLASSAGLTRAAAGKAESALALSGTELRQAVEASAWDLEAVPATHRGGVKDAAQELLDPLFPKFLLYDSNGNGAIDGQEFQHLVKATTGRHPSPEEFDELMRAVDVNQDGDISFREFKDFHDHHQSPVATSLRERVFETLLAAEEATLHASSPLFQTTPSPVLLDVCDESGHSASLDKRLTLTRRARVCSTLCSMVLLFLVAALAFVPLLKLCDVAVPDTIDMGALAEELKAKDFQQNSKLAECQAWIKANCREWSRSGTKASAAKNGWAKSDYRRCARSLHPDKPSGSEEKFRKLTECDSSFEHRVAASRQLQYMFLLGFYMDFMFKFVVLAACSSTSAALLYTAHTLSDPAAAAVLVAYLPDMAERFRLFVALCAGSLALGTVALARYRGQNSLGGWLAGTHVCRIDGKAAGTLRVLALDCAQGLTGVAWLLTCVWVGRSLTTVIHIFASTPFALLVAGAYIVQYKIAAVFAVQFKERSLPEIMSGTLQRVNHHKPKLA